MRALEECSLPRGKLRGTELGLQGDSGFFALRSRTYGARVRCCCPRSAQYVLPPEGEHLARAEASQLPDGVGNVQRFGERQVDAPHVLQPLHEGRRARVRRQPKPLPSVP